MKILLDTNVFLWAAGIDGNLSETATAILRDPDVPIVISAVTAWEIAIKWSKGRLTLPEKPVELIRHVISAAGLLQLPVTLEDACKVAELARYHNDPFDRLLVVQAQSNGLSLMTADPELERYEVDVVLCKQNK
ncbi:MAG: type II toxin-antitoxin system VapC family toxin [Pyrinomonadaceae bacterium]